MSQTYMNLNDFVAVVMAVISDAVDIIAQAKSAGTIPNFDSALQQPSMPVGSHFDIRHEPLYDDNLLTISPVQAYSYHAVGQPQQRPLPRDQSELGAQHQAFVDWLTEIWIRRHLRPAPPNPTAAQLSWVEMHLNNMNTIIHVEQLILAVFAPATTYIPTFPIGTGQGNAQWLWPSGIDDLDHDLAEWPVDDLTAIARLQAELARLQVAVVKSDEDWVREYVESLESVDHSTIPEEDKRCPICYLDFGETDEFHELYQPPPLPADPAEQDAVVGFQALPFNQGRPNNNAVRTPCNHLFGKDCLMESLAERSTCPKCRKELRY